MKYLGYLGIIAAGLILWLFLSLFPAHSQDTNPPDIQKWYRELTNRMGGSCCGDGDAYPAAVTKMPTATDNQGRESYNLDGEVCITDPSSKDIVVHGVTMKVRPQLHGQMCQPFSWMKMAREKYGNPFDHAIAFVATDASGNITGIWCVVILPMLY